MNPHSEARDSPDQIWGDVHEPLSWTPVMNHIHKPLSWTPFTIQLHESDSQNTFTIQLHESESWNTFTIHIHESYSQINFTKMTIKLQSQFSNLTSPMNHNQQKSNTINKSDLFNNFNTQLQTTFVIHFHRFRSIFILIIYFSDPDTFSTFKPKHNEYCAHKTSHNRHHKLTQTDKTDKTDTTDRLETI